MDATWTETKSIDTRSELGGHSSSGLPSGLAIKEGFAFFGGRQGLAIVGR